MQKNCYEPHHAYDPKRIMLGSETYPHSMAERWKLVEAHPYVIGDFMWTAMDYLGKPVSAFRFMERQRWL